MKPVVHFIAEADFEPYYYDGKTYEVAYVYALDHPKLGKGPVRTSTIVEKFDDGSFETCNTLYKPWEKNNG